MASRPCLFKHIIHIGVTVWGSGHSPFCSHISSVQTKVLCNANWKDNYFLHDKYDSLLHYQELMCFIFSFHGLLLNFASYESNLEGYLAIFGLAIMWGFGHAIVNSQISALLGTLFPLQMVIHITTFLLLCRPMIIRICSFLYFDFQLVTVYLSHTVTSMELTASIIA